jgi:hypothetical protein
VVPFELAVAAALAGIGVTNADSLLDSAYLDLGVRLVDVAGRAAELYEKYGLLERRGFLASTLQNVTLKDGIVTAEYRPAFRVLAQMAAESTPPPNVRGGGSRSSKLTVWGG